MEHCALHTRAEHANMCFEREVAGSKNWKELLELLPGGFHTKIRKIIVSIIELACNEILCQSFLKCALISFFLLFFF